MKRTRKILAVILAVTVALSMSATALASSTTQVIKGEGDTTYVVTSVMQVILPTDENWDFSLDPQGLVGAAKDEAFSDGKTGTISPEDLEPYAGLIVASDYAPMVVNLSSREVLVSVDIKVVGTNTDLVTVDSPDDFDEDVNSIALELLMSKDSVDFSQLDEVAEGYEPNITWEDDITEGHSEPVTKAGKVFGFVLEAPKYLFTSDGTKYGFERDEDHDGYGTMVQLGGKVNRGADWTEFVDDEDAVGIEAEFSFRAATQEEIDEADFDDDPPYEAYGFIGEVDGSGGNGGGGDGGDTTPALLNGSTPYTNFPSPIPAGLVLTVRGIPADATINSIDAGGVTLVVGTGAGQHYTASGNVISFTAGRAWPPLTTSNDMTIQFTPSGGSQQTVTITGLTYSS